MKDRMLLAMLAIVIVVGVVIGYGLTVEAPSAGECRIDSNPPSGNGAQVATNIYSSEGPGDTLFGNDSEIGKPCEEDSDCLLPWSYAIRSSCPYDMRCKNGSCEAYCPFDEPGFNLTPINATSDSNDSLTVADTEPQTRGSPLANLCAGSPESEPCAEDNNVTLIFFWAIGCPICAEEKKFIDEIRSEYPALIVLSYEVSKSDPNAALLASMCADHQMHCDHVPITFVGDMAFKSYKGDEGALIRYAGEQSFMGYGSQIENALRAGFGLQPKEVPIDWESSLELSASTDKALYYAKEDIHLNVTIWVSDDVNGFYVRGRGVDGRFDDYEMIDLEAGNNTVVLKGQAPACFGCADFRPGEYEIDVTLERGDETLKEITLTIEIRDSG